MAQKTVSTTLPLGISRLRQEDAEELRKIFVDFTSIKFNLSRFAENCYSIRITRQRSELHDLDETVTGMLGDQLRLTNGEYVEFRGHEKSCVLVHFKS